GQLTALPGAHTLTELADPLGPAVPGAVARLHAVALLSEHGELVLPLGALVGILPVAVALAVAGLAEPVVGLPDDPRVFLLQGGDAALHQEMGHPDEEQQRGVQENHGCPPIGLLV